MSNAISVNPRRWVTVAQLAELPEYRGAFSVAALRHLVFLAESRISSRGEVVAGNGLAETGAIIRVGRKVLIDAHRFDAWLDAHGTANRSLQGGV